MKQASLVALILLSAAGCCSGPPSDKEFGRVQEQMSGLRGMRADDAKRFLRSQGFQLTEVDARHVTGHKNLDFCLQMLGSHYIAVYVDLDDSGRVVGVNTVRGTDAI